MSAYDIPNPTYSIGGKTYKLARLENKVSELYMHLPDTVLQSLDEVILLHVLVPIRVKMTMDGISQKIVQSTHFERHVQGSRITWSIISDYKTIDGFPVAVMIEEGRRAFYLRPRKDRNTEHERHALSWIQGGKRVFSMGHEIPEYIPRKYIEYMIEEKHSLIEDKVNKRVNNYIRSVMLS